MRMNDGKTSKISKATKTIAAILIRLIAAVLAGTVLMLLVYLLPVAPIETHVANSADIFEEEGPYPSFTGIKYCNSDRDNYTDAWMLLEAVYYSDESPLMLSASNYRNKIGESDPVESLVQHYKYGKEFDSTIMYGRYWNGYLVYLKPLLVFLDYSAVRVLNIIIQSLLVAAIIILLVRRGKAELIVPYLLSILMVMPFAIVLNIQQSTCYTILNLGIIAILLSEKHLDKKGLYIFLFLGIATAFFDLLSYPLVTFGVPAVFYFCFIRTESIKDSLFRLIKIGSAWCIGYGGMWVGKWIVGSILSGQNLISDGINQVVFRAGSDAEMNHSGESFSVFETIINNIRAFILTPATLAMGAFVVVMLVLIIRLIIKNQIKYESVINLAFPYILLLIAPFVWYTMIRNHSAIHAYSLSNKELIIAAMAVSCLCARLYQHLKREDLGSKTISNKEIRTDE